jgi:hypothetical protein
MVFPERLERGGPCWLVETELNGDSKISNERGRSLVGSLGLLCWYKRFLFILGYSSQPRTIYVVLFQFFVLIGQQAGRADALGRLSLSMCCSGCSQGPGLSDSRLILCVQVWTKAIWLVIFLLVSRVSPKADKWAISFKLDIFSNSSPGLSGAHTGRNGEGRTLKGACTV